MLPPWCQSAGCGAGSRLLGLSWCRPGCDALRAPRHSFGAAPWGGHVAEALNRQRGAALLQNWCLVSLSSPCPLVQEWQWPRCWGRRAVRHDCGAAGRCSAIFSGAGRAGVVGARPSAVGHVKPQTGSPAEEAGSGGVLCFACDGVETFSVVCYR